MDSTLGLALYLLAGLAATLIGAVLGALIAAIWLRLAVAWLGFRPISYWAAFKSALIANFTIVVLHASVSINHGFLVGYMSNADQRPMDTRILAMNYPPHYFLHAMLFGLLIMAAIFCRTIPVAKDDPPLTYPQGLAIASFYQALSVAFMLLLGLLAYCIAAGWTSTTSM